MTSATSLFKADLTLEQAIEVLYAPFPAEDHEFHPFFKIVYLKEEAINRRLTSVFGFNWNKIIVEQHYHAEGFPTIMVKAKNNDGKESTYHLPLDQYPGEVYKSAGGYFIKKIVTKQVARFGNDGKPLLDETTKKPITDPVDEEVEQPIAVTYDIPYIVSRGYMEVRFSDQIGRRDDVGADVLTDLGKERGAREHNTWKTSSTDLLKRLARQFGVGLYLTEIKGAAVKVTNYETLAKWLKEAYDLDSDPNINKLDGVNTQSSSSAGGQQKQQQPPASGKPEILSKDDFKKAVIALGVPADKIGVTLQERGILNTEAEDKYRVQLDLLKKSLQTTPLAA